MPNLRKRSHKRVSHLTTSRSLEDIRASVKVQKLSRKLYALPLELKVMIFQFAIISNMADWSKVHAEKFREILGRIDPLSSQVSTICLSNGWERIPYPARPAPICEKCPNVRRKVTIPWDWVSRRVTEERYDQLECRDWGPENLCEYWHHPKCWCRDCYDIRDLSRVYHETMRQWFLKYQGLKTEWIVQLRDRSICKEKRDLKLGFIDIRRNKCIDEAPDGFWDYLDRNYTWSENLWAYVPK